MAFPLTVLLMTPTPAIALLGYEYFVKGNYVEWYLWLAIALIVVGWGGALLIHTSLSKLITRNVYLDIRPNLIQVSDGTRIDGLFSSKSRFLTDADLFNSALEQVVNRAFADNKKIVAIRETAHVRVWPGELGITPLEQRAIAETIAFHFLDPTFEVVADGCEPKLAEPQQIRHTAAG